MSFKRHWEENEFKIKFLVITLLVIFAFAIGMEVQERLIYKNPPKALVEKILIEHSLQKK